MFSIYDQVCDTLNGKCQDFIAMENENIVRLKVLVRSAQCVSSLQEDT